MRTDINYYYTTEWRDRLIDSSRFARSISHQNPRYFSVLCILPFLCYYCLNFC